ncbi:MAG TPA: MFS transporter [Acidimicrobiales bacterium]|nr:MFS transporter [Acidimicrobiales bacterium]
MEPAPDAPRRAGGRTGGSGDRAGALSLDAPGIEPVGVVPWPLLWRDRVRHRLERSERYPWIVLATALFGLFTVGFTITILAVSVPGIADDLGAAEATLTWVVTGPILAFAIVGPAAGKLADLHGPRRIYLLGLLGSAVFAGLTALAWSAPSLIAFRVLGATLGAACGPASMAMVNRLFPREVRAQAMGYWSLVMAGGPVLGVVAGGPIVEAFGWRWIFVAQVPFVIAGLLVAYALLPDTERGERQPFDIIGSITLGGTTALALFALNRGPLLGWDHPVVVGGFAFAPIGIALFVWRQRTFSHPLIPLEYLRRRNVVFPVLTQMFTNFAYMGGFILTPLLLQDVMGYGEARTGLLSISRPLLFAIAGPVAGYLAVRAGERPMAVFGAICVVASMLGLAQVGPGASDLLIIGALGLSGIGLGASSPAMAATIANAVDESDLGIAGAAQQMMSQVAVVAGIQILQTVQTSREAVVGTAASYQEAYLVGGAVAALAIVTASFVRSTRDERVDEPVAADSRELATSAGQ